MSATWEIIWELFTGWEKILFWNGVKQMSIYITSFQANI